MDGGPPGLDGSGDQRFEDRAMGRVAAVQILRMPLHAEEEPPGGILHGFDDSVRRRCTDLQSSWDRFDSLMMRAVYLHGPAPQNVAETGAGNHPDGVTDGRSRTRHPVLRGILD